MNKPETPLMTRVITRALKPLILLLAVQTAGAKPIGEPEQDRWFQVDMVVFVNKDSMNGPEKWPAISPHTIPVNAITLRNPDAISSPPGITDLLKLHKPGQQKSLPDLERESFISLPRESHTLLKQGNTLETAKGYRVINRSAWIMPLQDDSTTKPIQIYNYSNTGKPSLLEGSVQISSSRYLHADVNLWYSELSREALSHQLLNEVSDDAPDADQDSATTEPNSSATPSKPVIRLDLHLVTDSSGTPMKITRNFQLRESRRIRNTQQIQYLDSPVLGVLIKLTPYERPEEPLLPEIEAHKEQEPILGLLPGLG